MRLYLRIDASLRALGFGRGLQRVCGQVERGRGMTFHVRGIGRSPYVKSRWQEGVAGRLRAARHVCANMSNGTRGFRQGPAASVPHQRDDPGPHNRAGVASCNTADSDFRIEPPLFCVQSGWVPRVSPRGLVNLQLPRRLPPPSCSSSSSSPSAASNPSKNATHCDETPSWTGRSFSPPGDRWFRVWACPSHLEG